MRERDYLPGSAFEGALWQKAAASQPNDDCVQFAKVGDVIGVRDSKLGAASPILQFTEAEIAAMLSGARNGEFDHLI
ncbi:DUF397 domain-containing protein [Kibdelosporangium persicum]|uniref:DUF397 domain-containing protein n=1 Tax=Kibdelosporangium persicum TaxID=2698649 RepID=UPI001FEA8B4F|nr:DUF397 domain-containing protein [Kibdelosporangium persicum]